MKKTRTQTKCSSFTPKKQKLYNLKKLPHYALCLRGDFNQKTQSTWRITTGTLSNYFKANVLNNALGLVFQTPILKN